MEGPIGQSLTDIFGYDVESSGEEAVEELITIGSIYTARSTEENPNVNSGPHPKPKQSTRESNDITDEIDTTANLLLSQEISKEDRRKQSRRNSESRYMLHTRSTLKKESHTVNSWIPPFISSIKIREGISFR